MTQDKHVKFLEFALDMTLYKTQTPLVIKYGHTFASAMTELYARMDKFFQADYQPFDQKEFSLLKLSKPTFLILW